MLRNRFPEQPAPFRALKVRRQKEGRRLRHESRDSPSFPTRYGGREALPYDHWRFRCASSCSARKPRPCPWPANRFRWMRSSSARSKRSSMKERESWNKAMLCVRRISTSFRSTGMGFRHTPAARYITPMRSACMWCTSEYSNFELRMEPTGSRVRCARGWLNRAARSPLGKAGKAERKFPRESHWIGRDVKS